jgi:hypothetical protein
VLPCLPWLGRLGRSTSGSVHRWAWRPAEVLAWYPGRDVLETSRVWYLRLRLLLDRRSQVCRRRYRSAMGDSPTGQSPCGYGDAIPAGQRAASTAYASFMALFAVSLTLPVRPTSRQPGSVLTGRLESSLPAEVGGPVLDARLASQLLRGRRVARTRWAMTVRAADPAKALTLAVDALRHAMGADARSWDVAAMEATVNPVAGNGPWAL